MRHSVLLFVVAAAVLATSVPDLALAQAMPMRRDGLWEMTMKMSSPMPMTTTMRQCTDAAEERAGAAFQSGGPQQAGVSCKAGTPLPAPGGGWSYTSVCTMRGMTMTTKGVTRGDFRTGYHMESTTRMEPAPVPQMAETKMVMDSKWIGPCPADMKPGDTIVNGRKIPKPKARG